MGWPAPLPPGAGAWGEADTLGRCEHGWDKAALPRLPKPACHSRHAGKGKQQHCDRRIYWVHMALRLFCFDCSSMSSLEFRAGAMPQLRRLLLELDPLEWDEVTPVGLEQLPCLEEIRVLTASSPAVAAGCELVEERSALVNGVFHANILPSHPTLFLLPRIRSLSDHVNCCKINMETIRRDETRRARRRENTNTPFQERGSRPIEELPPLPVTRRASVRGGNSTSQHQTSFPSSLSDPSINLPCLGSSSMGFVEDSYIYRPSSFHSLHASSFSLAAACLSPEEQAWIIFPGSSTV
ncbi:hypothetical protein U9M48_041296 [Paspalum notatum var. saurae]|uniref:Uncharacterized protein n=1 Tax=Paspalum notatum var. saurae TaxID=547442 RepID=A0AAQ3UQ82_PASNO